MLMVHQKVPIIIGKVRSESNIHMLDLEHIHCTFGFRNNMDYILIIDNNIFRVVVLSFIQSVLPLLVHVPYL